MKTKISKVFLMLAFVSFAFTECAKEGMQGPKGSAGQNASVYYSEWFSSSSWSGNSGDWYFNAVAPDLTQDIVENGVVLAYVWLANDLYAATTVRPLPAFAVGANWSFLIHQYGNIEFSTDMVALPLTSANKFRFIAIPGTLSALKSASSNIKTATELKSMTYKEVCAFYHIPE